jgi:Glu-tRNA(Gln) amidotransferase subunit E-like FAD-binding protein
MTPEDAEQITAIVAAAEQRTAQAIEAAKGETAQAIEGAKGETVEAMRDMQTEILRGLEAFARGNFARMHRIETSDADTNTRISALEERVLYLETRRPPQ